MQIVPVSREAIEAALHKFDDEWRNSKDYAGWEKNKNYLHAVSHNGRFYPPKQIISLATSMPLTSFYGGAPSNNYLIERGFTIVPTSSVFAKPIPSFTIGKLYSRSSDIHEAFGGSKQSGISPSGAADAIFLFTGDSGEQYGYKDGPKLDDDGNVVYLYTGEGQVGDMQFTRGNLAISQHVATGRALHLFHALGKSKPYRYLGEYICAGHELRTGEDREGTLRKLIVFQLLAVADAEKFEEIVPTDVEPVLGEQDLAEARRRALAAVGSAAAAGEHSVRNLYKRSRAVREYVFLRAKGMCESCKRAAPFRRPDGSPYLEPHHTTRVSDGGPDHPAHVGAICATCHREIHHGANGATKNAELRAYLSMIEHEGA